MPAKPTPASPIERPLWIIAWLLFGIVLCLVFFVLQSLVHDQPGPVAPPELPKRLLTSDEPPAPRRIHDPLPVIFVAPTHPAPAPVEPAVPAPALSPQSEPIVAPVPQTLAAASGGGYAPLSYLGQTNYRTAIIGTVTLHGLPPAEQPLDLASAPYCAGLQSKPLTTRFFVVGPDGGLADALVFIRDGLNKRASFTVSAEQQLTFANCQIEPYVTAMTFNQHLLIGNQDAVTHAFRVGTPRSHELKADVYPGKPVSLSVPVSSGLFLPCSCQIHPWEKGFVSVLSHPYFAVTDTDGKFAITNVPPGKYVLQAVHQKSVGTNGPTRQLELHPGQTVTANFVLEAPAK